MVDHNIRRCYSSENLQVLLMTGPFLLAALAYRSVIKKLSWRVYGGLNMAFGLMVHCSMTSFAMIVVI